MNNEPVACDCSRVLHECSEKEGCRMLAQLNTHPADAEKVKENMDKVLKQNERLIEALAKARITLDAEIEKKNTMLKMWEATHPAKTLTDEEITEVLNDENIAEYHQGTWLLLPYAFARAILRKAQEK